MNLQYDIMTFLANGGVIQQLPPQEFIPKRLQGKRNKTLTPSEAARILGVSYDSLNRSRKSGKLKGWPAPKFTVNSIRSVTYTLHDIETWKTIHGLGV